jgi:hypothetical protein
MSNAQGNNWAYENGHNKKQGNYMLKNIVLFTVHRVLLG